MKGKFQYKTAEFIKKSQRGFSLLEMMVAVTIFLIVTGSIFGLLQIGRIDRNRASRRSDMLKSARTAIHLMGRDVLNAGMSYHQRGAIAPDDFISTRLGITPDADTKRDLLTSVIAGNDLFTNSLNPDPTVRTDLISFTYREMTYNAGNTVSLSNVAASADAANTARLTTLSNISAVARDHDLCLIESDSSQIAVMITGVPGANLIDTAPTDPLGLNQAFDGTGSAGSLLKKCTALITTDCTSYVASAKKFIWVAYKVKDDGTLVRMIYGNNTGRPANEQIQEQPLAYNVQNLQFKYVLADGTVTEKPSAGADGIVGTADDQPENLNLIRQVSIMLQVQSTEIDEQTRKPAVITLNATFSLRNMEYDAG